MKQERYKDSRGCFIDEWRNLKGELRRENGPAQIICRLNDSVFSEAFWINGKRHRDDGPAQTWYNIDGSAQSYLFNEFWFRGAFLGIDEEGFWNLWKILDEERRQAPEILKYLMRFS